jgi:hypothetical protein
MRINIYDAKPLTNTLPKQTIQKLDSITDNAEKAIFLANLPNEQYPAASQYVKNQRFDALPFHKKVGEMVKNVGQWFKAQLPKKEEKAGNDIIAMSWDEAGH